MPQPNPATTIANSEDYQLHKRPLVIATSPVGVRGGVPGLGNRTTSYPNKVRAVAINPCSFVIHDNDLVPINFFLKKKTISKIHTVGY